MPPTHSPKRSPFAIPVVLGLLDAQPQHGYALFAQVQRDLQDVWHVGMNRLYALLARAAGVDRPAQHAPATPGEQMRSSVDPSLAAKVLGWRPAVALEEGLQRTVGWFRD